MTPSDPSTIDSLTLRQLQQRVQAHLLANDLRDVWVTAELSDVRVSGGHCYMELLEKDANGKIVAKARAAAWANVYRSIAHNFMAVTGQQFATGLKVMLRISVSYHEVFGMTMVVNDVNPEFTMGDLLRRRRESIMRLQREGILELNRKLTFPTPTLRIAVISARTAAGFGDFANQLFNNPSRLAFKVSLFQARLQGEQTSQSILAALERIASAREQWDCVVIIRGGGASSDLIAFEDYDLAAAIARFPLPVIIGIGHERDITLLDYVANMRVKTPTAAAEWLITEGEKQLDALRRIALMMGRTASDRLAGSAAQLSMLSTRLRLLPLQAMERSRAALTTCTLSLAGLSASRIAPAAARLDTISENIRREAATIIRRQSERLESFASLIDAFSPMATLRRGYTITRLTDSGKTLRSVADATEGALLTTTLPDGRIISATVKHESLPDNR